MSSNESQSLAMTESRAAILRAMWQYSLLGYKLTILEVQKLAYFLQLAGQDLRLDFKKHHYGPYADTLRHAINNMEGHYLQGDGDGNSKPSAEIRILQHAPQAADTVLQKHPESARRFKRVAKLIEGFETPYGMELLATAHWVSTHELGAQAEADSVVTAVHAWSKRKAERFKAEDIRTAWQRLKEHDWLD